MAWPDDEDLPIGVLAAFGADLTAHPASWVFTDLTDRKTDVPISIRKGASDGAGRPSPGTSTVHLLDDDGALVPLNPTSEFWPNVEMNTPVLVTVDRPGAITDSDTFAASETDSWGSTSGGRAWNLAGAGGSVLFSDWQVASGAATHSVPVANGYRLSTLDALDVADQDVAVTVSAAVTPTGAAIEPGNVMLRVNGSDHYLLRLSVATTGTITASINSAAVGTLVTRTVPGLTWSSGVPLRIRAQAWGTWLRMRVWRAADPEPTTWTLVTSDNQIASGSVGVRSGVASGNTNAKPIIFSYDNFEFQQLPAVRLDGFADQWQPTFIPTTDGGTVSACRLTSSGLLRRLTQGRAPLRSAARRAILAAEPVAYWPLEGGEDLNAAESAVGGAELAPLGTVAPRFGGVAGPPGSDALPDLSSHGVLFGPVPTYSHTGEWQVEFWFRTETGDSLDFTASVPLQWDTPGGSLVAWDVLLFVGQGDGNPGLGSIALNVGAYEDPGDGGEPTESHRVLDLEILTSSIPSVQGSWHHLRVCADQTAPTTVQLTAYLDNVLLGSASASYTIGPVTRVTVNPLQGDGAYAGVDGIGLSSVGHVAVYGDIFPTGAVGGGLGHSGELAAARIARLCAEEGVHVEIVGLGSEPMGPQRMETLPDLLFECAAADGGILSEHQFGLRYRTRGTRYNIGPSLTVDLAEYAVTSGDSARVLTPSYDDQQIRNEWTISRPGGLEATYRDEAHIQRYGRYDDAAELVLATDSRLLDHAAWRVHLGTWPEMRYPAMPLDLAANPDLVNAWLDLLPGDRVVRTNAPAPHPPGDIDQIVGGYSETLAPRSWRVAANTSPARPWQVFVLGSSTHGRLGARGYTLAAGIDSTATTLTTVRATDAAGWVTTVAHPTHLPFDVVIGGERMTVTAISLSTNTYTFTVTRSVNGVVKTHATGSAIQVADLAALAL